MQFLIRVAAAGVLFAAGASHSEAAQRQIEPPSSIALNVVPDPGPAPVFVAADYDAYRMVGTSQIYGRLPDPGGDNDESCGSAQYLYPDTPYVRWMIATWARQLDGRRLRDGLFFPDDESTGVWSPPYLSANYLTESTSRAVVVGRCLGDSRNVVFDNIPAGVYTLVSFIRRESVDTHARMGYVQIITPSGLEGHPVYAGSEVGGSLGNGYVLGTRRPLVVEAGHNYTLNPDFIAPIAQYRQ